MPRSAPTERVQKILGWMQENTAEPVISLTLRPETSPALTASKTGGLPCWNPALPYPVSAEGQKLILLAQVNCADLPKPSLLPETGLLQFFIAPDDLMGLDFKEPDKGKGFRVIYHPETDLSVTAEQLKSLGIPSSEELTDDGCFPLEQTCALTFESRTEAVSMADYRFDGLFRRAMRELFGEDIGDAGYYDVLEEAESEFLAEKLGGEGSRMLGTGFFTQSDPRGYQEELQRYDTLLFQLDSDTEYVLWGDCGVGNFFIARDDLKKRDFSRILYNWDCC